MDEKTGKPMRIAVQVLIYSETLSSEEMSSRLDLQPTSIAEKGIKYGKRTGTRMNIPRHLWQLSSEPHVSNEDLTSHLDWVLVKLSSVRERLRALQENEAVRVILQGTIWTSGTSAHVHISPQHAEILAALRLELNLEFADYGEDDVATSPRS